jgi:4-amino-4-deoxy-L-arabinose transferase-like glycosyltransferase
MRLYLITMAALQAAWVSILWFNGMELDQKAAPVLMLLSFLSTLVVFGCPNRLSSGINRFKEKLFKTEAQLLGAVVLLALAVGGIYAGYRTVGIDESGFYLIAKVLAESGWSGFLAEYQEVEWISRDHPPLILLLYGLGFQLLGVKLFVLRFFSLLFGAGTLLLVYRIGKRLYDRETGLMSALFPYFFRWGIMGTNDMASLFFFTWAVLLSLKLLDSPSLPRAVSTGVVAGIGLLSKYTMALIYPVLLAFSFEMGGFKKLKSAWAPVLMIPMGLLSAWWFFAMQIGVFSAQMDTLGSYATAVTTTGEGWPLILSNLFLKLPSALGVYNMPLLLLGSIHLLLNRTTSNRIVIGWIAAVFIPIMLTLPKPNYFIPCFPALAIALARGWSLIETERWKLVALALAYALIGLARGV